jgi:hypothetical protein
LLKTLMNASTRLSMNEIFPNDFNRSSVRPETSKDARRVFQQNRDASDLHALLYFLGGPVHAVRIVR